MGKDIKKKRKIDFEIKEGKAMEGNIIGMVN